MGAISLAMTAWRYEGWEAACEVMETFIDIEDRDGRPIDTCTVLTLIAFLLMMAHCDSMEHVLALTASIQRMASSRTPLSVGAVVVALGGCPEARAAWELLALAISFARFKPGGIPRLPSRRA